MNEIDFGSHDQIDSMAAQFRACSMSDPFSSSEISVQGCCLYGLDEHEDGSGIAFLQQIEWCRQNNIPMSQGFDRI
jgi:hypothetical protein